MQHKQISIIIATYNAEPYLQLTLDSLKLQTCKNFELIIVDGDSKDNTLSIIMSNKEIITKYISEPDKGIYDAWNKGIKISNGKWICFLGAGDTLIPDAFSKYIELINQVNEDFDYVSARIKRVDESGHFLTEIGEPWNWRNFKKIMTTAHVGSLHNRNLFEELGLFNTDYKICSDYEFLLRKKSDLRCLFLDQIIGCMPIGGVSFSVAALCESAKAKYMTGKQPFSLVIFTFITQLILLKTFRLRHK